MVAAPAMTSVAPTASIPLPAPVEGTDVVIPCTPLVGVVVGVGVPPAAPPPEGVGVGVGVDDESSQPRMRTKPDARVARDRPLSLPFHGAQTSSWK